MKISKKWRKMSEYYKHFALDSVDYDWSEDAAKKAYILESQGQGIHDNLNGYMSGKQWMDVTVSQWKEDILGFNLHIQELREDYPDWFLKKVLPNGWIDENPPRWGEQ